MCQYCLQKLTKIEDTSAEILIVFVIFQAEARAEFAERSVQKLQKEVDRLEGNYFTDRHSKFVIITINIIT